MAAATLRDAIEEKLSREKTLAGSVGKLFEYVPAHLVPIDEHVVKAGVILDRLCFNMLAQRLLNTKLARRATDALFDELDADATGFLSLLEIVRRIQKVNTLPSTNFVDAPKGPSRPKVTPAEVDAVQAALVAKLEGMVRQDTALLSTIVMFFEKASHAGEVTHKRGKMRVLSQAEFHHLLVRMLHIPVSREVSDGLFARILGMPMTKRHPCARRAYGPNHISDKRFLVLETILCSASSRWLRDPWLSSAWRRPSWRRSRLRRGRRP